MLDYLQALESTTTAKEDIRQSIKKPNIEWLLHTSACGRCMDYLAAYCQADTHNIDEQLQRYEAGRLLLILMAMEAGDAYAVREALCLLGARGVDARLPSAKQRRARAGKEREKPLTNERWYVRAGHFARMQQCLASELHSLVARPERLELALETNGATAVAKYL
jgi:hypothetical protein